MRTNHRRQLWILVMVLFVVMLGYGIIIPILPFYIDQMGAGGTELGLLVASYAVMRLFCGPVWGSLSDRIGRKPVLLIGILGYALTMIWFGLATQLWMLFAARILSGVLSSATAPTTMAYIGDSTPGNERGGGMGLLGAAGGVGTIVGPALGGLLGGETLAVPFFIAAGLSLLSLLLAALFLPESLSEVAKDANRSKDKLVDVRQWSRAIFGSLGVLFFLTFISTSGLMIFANVFGLYALERFDYGTQEVGIILMILGLASALTQGLLAGSLIKRWGNLVVIRVGMFATAVGLILMLLARDFIAVLLTTAFFGLATAIQVPALTSWTSQRATIPQGIAMGLSNAFISLGRIVGPLIGGFTFDLNIYLPYLSAAGVMILGFIVSLTWLRKQ